MSLAITTLSSGRLRQPWVGGGFTFGPRILYYAPRIGERYPEQSPATINKTALVTGMRFVNTKALGTTPVTINISFVRYSAQSLYSRPLRSILPIDLSLAGGQMFLDNLRLTLEEGDAILGLASEREVISYIISGMERDS